MVALFINSLYEIILETFQLNLFPYDWYYPFPLFSFPSLHQKGKQCANNIPIDFPQMLEAIPLPVGRAIVQPTTTVRASNRVAYAVPFTN